MYGGGIHDICSLADAPQRAQRGSPVQLGVLGRGVVGPGGMMLPLPCHAVPCTGEAPAVPQPGLRPQRRAVLLVVLLSVGDSVDDAMRRTFIGVLVRQLLILPGPSLLGQDPTQGPPQASRWRNAEGHRGRLWVERTGHR